MQPNTVLEMQMPRLGLFTGPTWHQGHGGSYRRHVDPDQNPDQQPGQNPKERKNNSRNAKEVHFAFIQMSYAPLEENEEKEKAKEEKKAKRKEKYKKYKKNVGKALRYSWKCLMLGLHNFSLGYSTPITVAATIIPEYRMGKTKS